MAKTIKFNLICDEHPIRSIDDLQNNFSIEDIIEYYRNRLLHRWLSVRGYNKELSAVKEISDSDDMIIIKKLIKIFEVSVDEKQIDKDIYILKHKQEQEKLVKKHLEDGLKQSRVVSDYEKKYYEIICDIIANDKDAPRIKANIQTLVDEYSWILKLDNRRLFWTVLKKHTLVMMCFLMNNGTRDFYLPINVKGKDGDIIEDIELYPDKKAMYKEICSTISSHDYVDDFSDELLVYSGNTDSYWKDLETGNSKYMIIEIYKESDIYSNDYIRSANKKDTEMSDCDIKNRFVILDGIDYKSNSSRHILRYMKI